MDPRILPTSSSGPALLAALPTPQGEAELKALLPLVGQNLEMVLLSTQGNRSRLLLPSGQVIEAEGELPFPPGTRLTVQVQPPALDQPAPRLKLIEALPPPPPPILAPLQQGEASQLLARLQALDGGPELEPLKRLFAQLAADPKRTAPVSVPAGDSPPAAGRTEEFLKVLPPEVLRSLQQNLAPHQASAPPSLPELAKALENLLRLLPTSPETGPTSQPGATSTLPTAKQTAAGTVPVPGSPPSAASGPPAAQGPRTALPMEPRTSQPLAPKITQPLDPQSAPPTDPKATPLADPKYILPIDPKAVQLPDPRTTQLVDPKSASTIDPKTTLPLDLKSVPSALVRGQSSPAPESTDPHPPLSAEKPWSLPLALTASVPLLVAQSFQLTLRALPPAELDPALEPLKNLLLQLLRPAATDKEAGPTLADLLARATGEAPGKKAAAPSQDLRSSEPRPPSPGAVSTGHSKARSEMAGASEFQRIQEVPLPQEAPSTRKDPPPLKQTNQGTEPGALSRPAPTESPAAAPKTWESWLSASVKALSDPQVSPREAPFHLAQAKDGTAFFELPLPWEGPNKVLQLWVEADSKKESRGAKEQTTRVLVGVHFSALGETRVGLLQSGERLQVRVWAEHPDLLKAQEEAIKSELADLGPDLDFQVLPLGEPGKPIPSLRSLAGGTGFHALG